VTRRPPLPTTHDRIQQRLARYGFGQARQYLIVHEDAFYDSKAIAE
jgi:hypothetical protein